jgi:hypothetical protein
METEHARDLRLQRTYGITLREYEELLADQSGVCAICHRPPKTRWLAVDHCHKWKYIKIDVEKNGDSNFWWATTFYAGRMIMRPALTKNKAIQEVRKVMKLRSIRGLLCSNCNPGLRKFMDDPNSLCRAGEYLFEHQAGAGFFSREN